MHLTKQECSNMLDTVLKETIGLLYENKTLSKEFNLNDFNPNEKKIEENTKKLVILNNIIRELKEYMNLI
jgi:hypothetical protein